MTGDHHWGRVVVPHVFRLVSLYLGQRDVCALLCVSASCHRQLAAHAPVCKVLDLQGRNNAGERLVAALSLVSHTLSAVGTTKKKNICVYLMNYIANDPCIHLCARHPLSYLLTS
jgi:hypothetical protein